MTMPKKRYVVAALIIANEIRGLIFVAGLLTAW